MTAIAAIRPRVAAEIVNCPNPQVDRVLRDSARELCRVPLWQERTTFSLPDSDQRVFELSTSIIDAEVVAMQGAPTVDNQPLTGWRMQSARTLVVDDLFNGEAEVIVSLRPTITAMTFPDVLALDWLDTVVAGALMRLYSMADDRWGNPTMAQYHGRRYRHGRNEAMASANRGFTDQPLRVRGRSFAHFRGT